MADDLRHELERLRRLDDLKSRFIALAAHELRAPAAVIRGLATTLNARAETLPAEQVELLHRLLDEQTDRLCRLMDQLLDLSRLDASSIAIERRRVAVRERLDDLVTSVAGERAEEVGLDVDERLETMVDPDAFDRIVGNLVTNALRYGRTPIRVAAEQADRHLRVTVEDDGDGVAPELEPRLFDRFSRGGRTAGAGLGLAIARSYAEAHGGEVLYEPRAPRGARFRVVLPAPRPDAAA